MLFEVGEDGADGDGLFAVGSSMLATIRSVPPQWPQVLTSMLTKSPGAIWNSRKAGPKGGGQDARSNTRLKRCAHSLPRLDPGSSSGARHVSERTLLYALVQAHYPDLIARLAAQDRSLPEYVREEFEAFLRCGVLENGFLRVVCEHYHADKFVWNEFEQP